MHGALFAKLVQVLDIPACGDTGVYTRAFHRLVFLLLSLLLFYYLLSLSFFFHAGSLASVGVLLDPGQRDCVADFNRVPTFSEEVISFGQLLFLPFFCFFGVVVIFFKVEIVSKRLRFLSTVAGSLSAWKLFPEPSLGLYGGSGGGFRRSREEGKAGWEDNAGSGGFGFGTDFCF